MWTKGIRQTILILTPFVILNALAMDIYLPSLPEIGKDFGVPTHLVQLTLSLYLLATGLGQIFLGPLADRFGRKPILLASNLIFFIASLLCAQANDIETLILSRILQGLGACGTTMVSFAIVRDAFAPSQGAFIYSHLNGFVALAPILAPVIGGYLSYWLGWRSSFYFLVAFSSLSLLVGLSTLQESLSQPSVIGLRTLKRAYLTIIRHRTFQRYTWCGGAALAAFFTFFSVSPIVVIEILGVPKYRFSYVFSGVALFFMFVSFLTPKITSRWGLHRSVATGAVFLTVGGFLMLLWHGLAGLSIAGLMLPMLVAMIGIGLILGSSTAGALAPFQADAGKAAAVYGAVQFCTAAAVGSLATSQGVQSCLPLASTLIVLGILSILICRVPTQEHAQVLCEKDARKGNET